MKGERCRCSWKGLPPPTTLRTLPRGCPGHSGLRALAAECPWVPGPLGAPRSGEAWLLFLKLAVVKGGLTSSQASGSAGLRSAMSGRGCEISHRRRCGRSVGTRGRKTLRSAVLPGKDLPSVPGLRPSSKGPSRSDSVREPSCLPWWPCGRLPGPGCQLLVGHAVLLGEGRALGLCSLVCGTGARALRTRVSHVNARFPGEGVRA